MSGLIYGGPNEAQGEAACRPDPEEMLQRSRRQHERLMKAIHAIYSLEDACQGIFIPGIDQDQRAVFAKLLGIFTLMARGEEKEQARLLMEIDKA